MLSKVFWQFLPLTAAAAAVADQSPDQTVWLLTKKRKKEKGYNGAIALAICAGTSVPGPELMMKLNCGTTTTTTTIINRTAAVLLCYSGTTPLLINGPIMVVLGSSSIGGGGGECVPTIKNSSSITEKPKH